MAIWKYTISPPIAILPGDKLGVLAGYLQHKRGGIVLQSRPLSGMVGAPISKAGEHLGLNSISTLYLEVPKMAALSITVASVTYNQDGSGTIEYSNSTGEEFASHAALVASVTDVNLDLVKMLLKKAWLSRSTDGTDPSWVIGKTLQLDLSLDMNQLTIGVVQ